MVHPFKIISEHVFFVEGLEFTIKGRVTEDVSNSNEQLRYRWDVSHYWNTTGGAYRPSANSSSNIKDTESLMMSYVNSFVLTHGVTANNYY